MPIYTNASDRVIRVGRKTIAPGSALDLNDAEAALIETREHVDAGRLTTRAKVSDAEAAKAAKAQG